MGHTLRTRVAGLGHPVAVVPAAGLLGWTGGDGDWEGAGLHSSWSLQCLDHPALVEGLDFFL